MFKYDKMLDGEESELNNTEIIAYFKIKNVENGFWDLSSTSDLSSLCSLCSRHESASSIKESTYS